MVSLKSYLRNLSVSKLDFPRVAKFKPLKQYRADYVPKAVKVERTYSDFLAFIEGETSTSWVEIDTIIGKIGGKVILTSLPKILST